MTREVLVPDTAPPSQNNLLNSPPPWIVRLDRWTVVRKVLGIGREKNLIWATDGQLHISLCLAACLFLKRHPQACQGGLRCSQLVLTNQDGHGAKAASMPCPAGIFRFTAACGPGLALGQGDWFAQWIKVTDHFWTRDGACNLPQIHSSHHFISRKVQSIFSRDPVFPSVSQAKHMLTCYLTCLCTYPFFKSFREVGRCEIGIWQAIIMKTLGILNLRVTLILYRVRCLVWRKIEGLGDGSVGKVSVEQAWGPYPWAWWGDACLPVIPVLVKWRQDNPWGLWTSQPSLISVSKFQRPCFQNEIGSSIGTTPKFDF